MKVVAHDPYWSEAFAAEEGIQRVTVAELLEVSDVVSIHAPLTAENKGMIDAAALAAMKSNAILINAARGGCMITADVAAALASGKLSAVAIDCHNPEPPGEDYPLFGLDGAILTPHIAARVPQAMENMSDVVRDIVAVLSGREPEFPAPGASQ